MPDHLRRCALFVVFVERYELFGRYTVVGKKLRRYAGVFRRNDIDSFEYFDCAVSDVLQITNGRSHYI